jgi:hypothetical protein
MSHKLEVGFGHIGFINKGKQNLFFQSKNIQDYKAITIKKVKDLKKEGEQFLS